MVTEPCFKVVAKPELLTVATVVSDELQAADPLTSLLLPSV
jgi:hypothetical protein